MPIVHQAIRHQDIDAGHRVVGHESKCRLIHGHRYRIHFTCCGNLDRIGRVIDFSKINSLLCQWVIDTWDHKLILWTEDPLYHVLIGRAAEYVDDIVPASIARVPCNPTAENLADHLLRVVAPNQLIGTAITCTEVRVDETYKCTAVARLDEPTHELRLHHART